MYSLADRFLMTLSCLAPVVAASDELGRVLLLDVEDFFVLRMWKGYRESECGWTSVCRQRASSGEGREGKGDPGEVEDGAVYGEGDLCLMIYAPRR